MCAAQFVVVEFTNSVVKYIKILNILSKKIYIIDQSVYLFFLAFLEIVSLCWINKQGPGY